MRRVQAFQAVQVARGLSAWLGSAKDDAAFLDAAVDDEALIPALAKMIEARAAEQEAMQRAASRRW